MEPLAAYGALAISLFILILKIVDKSPSRWEHDDLKRRVDRIENKLDGKHQL